MIQPVNLNELFNEYTKTNRRSNLDCSLLLDETNPTTKQEWIDIVEKQKHNLTWLANHAQEHQHLAKCNYSYEELYNYCKKLFIDDTWKGRAKELKAMKALTELQTKFPSLLLGRNPKFDSEYAVDIYVGISHPHKRMIGGIQVKPDTYLAHQRYQEHNQIGTLPYYFG